MLRHITPLPAAAAWGETIALPPRETALALWCLSLNAVCRVSRLITKRDSYRCRSQAKRVGRVVSHCPLPVQKPHENLQKLHTVEPLSLATVLFLWSQNRIERDIHQCIWCFSVGAPNHSSGEDALVNIPSASLEAEPSVDGNEEFRRQTDTRHHIASPTEPGSTHWQVLRNMKINLFIS